MGSKLSIDKHVSNVEDILEMDPIFFSKLKVGNNIPDSITQHIKIWRYSQDNSQPVSIRSSPVDLKEVLNASFNFVSNECYLVLFIYKKTSEEAPFINFPQSMWSVVESYNNLTPRGLETPVASSESFSNLNSNILESFLLPKSSSRTSEGKYEHMIFVWNGKTASALMKAITLSAALEFDSLITRAKDPLLQVLFSGGYIRNKKLWIGKVLQLDSSPSRETSQEIERKVTPMKDAVYLLKFLFPGLEPKIFKPVGFKERFLKSGAKGRKVEEEYVMMGDMEAEEEFVEEEQYHPESHPERHRHGEEIEEEVEPVDSGRNQSGASYDDDLFVESVSDQRKSNPAKKLPINLGGIGGIGNIGNIGNLGNLANLNPNAKTNIPAMKIPVRAEEEVVNGEIERQPYPTSGRGDGSSSVEEGGRYSNSERISSNQASNQETRRRVESHDAPGSSRRRESIEGYPQETRRGVEEAPPQSHRGGMDMPQPSHRGGLRIGLQPELASGQANQIEQTIKDHPSPSATEEAVEKGAFEKLRDMLDDDDEHAPESVRKKKRMDYFSQQCSAVIDNFLFVGGEAVAHNEEMIQEFGITHIVNAAGDVLENKFPDRCEYLRYYLKDVRTENIECIFYDAIEFMEKARKQNGKVLVHCVQGISRSVTICMAYLMMKHEFSFQEAYNHLREARGIASPNIAFWAQLFNFQIRLKGPFSDLPSPRVFFIGSFQIETPLVLVCRMISDVYQPKNTRYLDPRSVYIAYNENNMFLWIGNEILPTNKDQYIAKAEEHIKLLQKYEKAPKNYTTIQQGKEPQEFWSLWEKLPENRYSAHKDWAHYFVDLSTSKNVEGITYFRNQEGEGDIVAEGKEGRRREEYEEGELEDDGEGGAGRERAGEYEYEEEERAPIAYQRPGLYIFPELEPLTHIDMDYLDDNNLLVICAVDEEGMISYLWKGRYVAEEIDENDYLANILRQRWPNADPEDIRVCYEAPDDESDNFINYFQ